MHNIVIMRMSDVITNNILSGKRGSNQTQDELFDLSPPPPSKREKIDEPYYVGGGLLAPNLEPSLKFSVAPHRKTIGLKSSEVITQICATIIACELPLNVARGTYYANAVAMCNIVFQ